MTDKTPKVPARIHPDEQGRVAALNRVGEALRGAVVEKPPTSYYIPELIQCTFPHSDPKVRDWKKTNGTHTLIVSSGVDENLEPYGIPYGSFPRLTLAYIITEVVKSGSQHIELSAHFSTFLKEIGYTGNLKGNIRPARAVQSQLRRLLNARISFQRHQGDAMQGAVAAKYVEIAPEHVLWWDYRNPEQGSLWSSYINLSAEFHKSILENPVPLRTDILAALKKSPLALDVYMWVSYRLFTMQAARDEQITLGYGRLQEQFGTGISEDNYRKFRQEFKLALAKVAQYWVSPDGKKELLHYELHEAGLTLFSSPLLISVPKRKIAQQAAEEEATRILASRKFDDLTIKKARQIAGTKWDLRWLEAQYFTWIEQEKITPKDPCPHFLKFIKSHRERNEE